MLIQQKSKKAPLFLDRSFQRVKSEFIMFEYLMLFVFMQLTFGKTFVFLDKHFHTRLAKKLLNFYVSLKAGKKK